MRPLRALLLLLVASGAPAQTFVTYECVNGSPGCTMAIPDPPPGVSGSFVSLTMNVDPLCPAGMFVSEVVPRIDVTHPFVGDLSVSLSTPGAATVGLIERPLAQTGSCAGDNIAASFRDTAPPFACASTPPANGTDPIRPDSMTLSGLLPFATTGTWRLQVGDHATGNSGTLNSWSLTFTCVPLNVVTIAATDATGHESGDPIVFTVIRTGNPVLPLSVFVSFSGTATEAVDYTANPGVFFAAGETTATLTVTPRSDADVEGSETVIATIQPRPTYTVGSPSSAAGAILDPVSAPIPTLSEWMLIVLAAAMAVTAMLLLKR